MDFESDRRALEDFIDSRMNELGIDELSVEEFMDFAFEYFEANPVPDATIRTAREAMTYNRLTGEFQVDPFFQLIRCPCQLSVVDSKHGIR